MPIPDAWGGRSPYRVRFAESSAPDRALRLAVLSDLHVHHEENRAQMPALARSIRELGCQVVLLAGDLSHRLGDVDACLGELAVAKEHVFVPGNHDLWPVDEGSPGSRERHERLLPELCMKNGWKYLPHDGPVRFGSATFFGVMGWPDGSLVGPALEYAGTCEWSPPEPDQNLAREDAARLEAQLDRHRLDGGTDGSLVLVTHYPASERASRLVQEHGKTVHERDGQRLLERTWLPAVKEGIVERPPDLVVYGHRHGRYLVGEHASWALGYPWEVEKLGAFGESRFAALDLLRS